MPSPYQNAANKKSASLISSSQPKEIDSSDDEKTINTKRYFPLKNVRSSIESEFGRDQKKKLKRLIDSTLKYPKK